MTIWIVRRHSPHPYSHAGNYLQAFTIFSTHAHRAEAQNVVNEKMKNKNTNYLYTVGKVQLRGDSK